MFTFTDENGTVTVVLSKVITFEKHSEKLPYFTVFTDIGRYRVPLTDYDRFTRALLEYI